MNEYFKQVGSILSYYCQDCGCHINVEPDPVYVKVEVHNANNRPIEHDVRGWAKKFTDIMTRPVPSMILCLKCAHDHFAGELELHPGAAKPTRNEQ